MKRELVFAFGSNLDTDQMIARCPTALLVDVGVMHGFRLVFDGYSHAWGGSVADVWKAKGHAVQGAVWSVSPLDLKRLDAYEGHPNVYVRTTQTIVIGSGAFKKAQVYMKAKRQERGFPSASYLRRILNGYSALGLDSDSLMHAIAFSSPEAEL